MVTTRSGSKSPSKAAAPADGYPGFVRQPDAPPPFTLGQLRRAIPEHCFKRSTLRSSAYLATDLVLIAALYWAATFIDAAPVPAPARWALWAVYWYLQGAVATGVWVIGHECGHQAFSESQAINDSVGLVFHSLLLVPYYSWKHSHRRHHSNTNSVARDEVFVPEVLDPVEQEAEWPARLAVVRLARLTLALTLGWPAYLFFNSASRPYPQKRWVSHFDPWSPIFTKRERVEVAVSDAALLVVLYALGAAGRAAGWAWLVKTYVIPYLIVNFWLVSITLLQHNHPSLPHFTDARWNWMQGALSTVDRSYGRFLNTCHHHIQDTHVCHHLFSAMPHYHAPEATAALKKVLGPYYLYDERPFLAALWHDWSKCRYVAPDEPGSGVLWQRS